MPLDKSVSAACSPGRPFFRQLSSVLSVDIPNYRKGINTAREIENA